MSHNNHRIGEETEFWRGWHDRCRSRGQPHEQKKMWRDYFREFFGKEPEDHWFFSGRRFKGWHTTSDPSMFNPFVSLMLAKGGGLLPLFVLNLLDEQPRYGNEIMKEIQARTHGRWVSNPGVMYPMLSFMEDRNLVEGKWEDETRRTRRFYRITQNGFEELNRLKDVMKPRLMEALDILDGLLDEIYTSKTPRSKT